MTDSQSGERFSEERATAKVGSNSVRDVHEHLGDLCIALAENPAFSEFLPCPGCKNVPSLGDRYKCMILSCFT